MFLWAAHIYRHTLNIIYHQLNCMTCQDIYLSPPKTGIVNHDQTASSTHCNVCKDILLSPAMLLFLSLLPPSEKTSSEGQYGPSGPAKKQATQTALKENFHKLLGRRRSVEEFLNISINNRTSIELLNQLLT